MVPTMADTSEPNNNATQEWDGHSVIAVSFEDDGNAYTALTSLKELDSQKRIVLQEGVVVFRGEDGQLEAKDRAGSDDMPATAGGGLTGLLIGILGGPLGVLIGGTYGLMVGSLFDLYDMEAADSDLAALSSSVRLGHTGLLAVVDEPSPEVIDTAMAAVGGSVVRRPVADVETEIAAAEKAERAAKREARKELVRGRAENNKAAVNAKVDELKGKLHHEQAAGAAS
jgi:uncharacterized membrane protein